MATEIKHVSEEIYLLGARFEQQVSLYPDAPALTLDGASLTYRELNAQANRLAACLRQHGIGPESLVGVFLDRSFNLIVGILAILKAGGAYLPLDLACPEDRLAFMLKDSAAKVLLTDSWLSPRISHYSGQTICLDRVDLASYSPANGETTVRPDNLAYVIYTSGSTGTPKGVLVTHENVSRLFSTTEAWYQFGPEDAWSLFHSCAFDFSVWEIFGALLYGGRLVIVPYDVSRSAEAFHDLVVREKVTVLNQTPSAFRQFVLADLKRPQVELALRYIIFGGEALQFQSLKPWFVRHGAEQPLCVNMYGITETTVHTTYHPITAQEVESGSGSNIGLPLPDLQVYVVDEAGVPVQPGEVGEMLVGGKGVARGYLNRPDLTEARFVRNTLEPGKSPRLYRSGDSARLLASGELEYLGRIDRQVKIRGFRIELGEIETVLTRYPGVRECAVIARAEPGEEPRLVAYIVPESQPGPPLEDLRAHLAGKLPSYMVPAAYVFLESFPLTINGKLDRDKLPAPSLERPRLAEEYIAPQGELEEGLAKIWRNILHLQRVGTQDNFFNLGGDSLSAMTMIAQAEKWLRRPIGTRTLFEGATIKNIVAASQATEPQSSPPLMVCTQAGDAHRTPFFYTHGDYVFGGLYCQKLAQRLGPDQPFYAIAPHGTFGGEMPPTIEEMAAKHLEQIRSVQPHGPYRLGGFCNGAVAMFEVAQQLIRAGEEIDTLILLDPPDLYFFILRRRIMQVGKFFNLPEDKSRNIYQRIAEGVEIWRNRGVFSFIKAFTIRLVQWIARMVRGFFAADPAATKPNLDFHFLEALAKYEPTTFRSRGRVWIILRNGEVERHPQQISYWIRFIPTPRFDVVEGTHLEFKSSIAEISSIIRAALEDAP
jgi:amino acid adenylation domain-containing protein